MVRVRYKFLRQTEPLSGRLVRREIRPRKFMRRVDSGQLRRCPIMAPAQQGAYRSDNSNDNKADEDRSAKKCVLPIRIVFVAAHRVLLVPKPKGPKNVPAGAG